MPKSAEANSEHLLESLSRIGPEEYGSGYTEAVLRIYSMYVEMADRVSQRRQTANNFYLSINTLFLGAFSVASGEDFGTTYLMALCIAGIALCAFWRQNIESYRDLNSGKFSVINAIEEMLPLAPYHCEWEILVRGANSKQYRPFHRVEIMVPWVFAILYVVVLAHAVKWTAVFG